MRGVAKEVPIFIQTYSPADEDQLRVVVKGAEQFLRKQGLRVKHVDLFELVLQLLEALRAGEASIAESYAEVKDGQVWLINANIPEYSHGNRLNHEPRRPRKLLLHEREIEKFVGAVERKGMTLVPLMVYFNSQGRAKVELALAKGKQNHDKRDTIKERDWKRDQQRIMKAHS